MEIVFSNNIKIKYPSSELLSYCETNFKVSNPEYINKKKMGFWTRNISPVLYLYEYHKSKDLLIIPIGLFSEVKTFIGRPRIKIDLSDDQRVDINADIPLYDYQRKAVDLMKEKGYGILQSKAGSGKTQMGIALACELGYRTLWLTHTQDLLKQSYNRALLYLEKGKLGKVTDGKVEIGDITFATVQTMCKLNLSKYKYDFNTVIVDECHRVSGSPTRSTQFSKVLSSLAARHKYGLSATLHRADRMEKCMFAQLGRLVYSVPDAAIADKVMNVLVKRINTGIEYSDLENCFDTDGTLIYSKFLTSIGNCEKRNRLISEIVEDIIHKSNDRKVLILSDRVSHLKKLQCLVDGAELMVGSVAAKERDRIISNAKAGKIKVILSTYSLAKEGLDIPCLTDLIMATPVKDYAIVVQAVGRVARTAANKPQPVVYDLVDNIPRCYKMFLQRSRHYQQGGCNLCQ